MAFNYKECYRDNHKYCPYGVARRCESNCALYDKTRDMCAHMIIAQVMAKQLEEEDLERERRELLNSKPGITARFMDEALNSGDGSYKP